MELSVNKTESCVTVTVEGRVDSNTAPQMEEAVKGVFDDCATLIFDFTHLDYMSSAGLRVLLGAQKKMNATGGQMRIRRPNETILEVFEVTGMIHIFTIEQ